MTPGDVRYWGIVDRKLYVNSDAGMQAQWVRDIPGFILAADRNWPAILTR